MHDLCGCIGVSEVSNVMCCVCACGCGCALCMCGVVRSPAIVDVLCGVGV